MLQKNYTYKSWQTVNQINGYDSFVLPCEKPSHERTNCKEDKKV